MDIRSQKEAGPMNRPSWTSCSESDGKMKRISVQELQAEGYAEDRKSLRRFEARYAPFSIIGVILFFCGLYLASSRPSAGYLMVIGGFLLILAACLHGAWSAPRSLASGRVMERYRRSDCEPGGVEYVYVDRSSMTYCSRAVFGLERTGIFRKNGDDNAA